MDVIKVTVASLVVLLVPFLWAGIHFRRYGYIQGFMSLITMPVLTEGIGKLLKLIFKDNLEVFKTLEVAFSGLNGIYDVYHKLMTFTEISWLYETNWFYLPFAALLILTWGFSMTLRRKRKAKSENS